MIAPEEPQTVYEFLDIVRKRPGMYFGRPGRIDLLDALRLGMSLPKFEREDPPLDDFNPWLAVRISEISDTHNMVPHWLEEKHGAEKAFDVYLEYLDEYRRNSTELLQHAEGPFSPNFYQLEFENGVEAQIRPPSPERLVIGRFVPSHVYFWQQDLEKSRRSRPFFCSASRAKRAASDMWGGAIWVDSRA